MKKILVVDVPALALTGVLALVLGGCSGETQVPDFEREFSADLELIIEEAREGNASAHQIQVLETARETGEITLQEARDGAHEMATCLTDLGWNANFVETTAADGMVLPSVTVSVPESEADLDPTIEMDQCERAHFYWLNQMYSTQPLAMELAYAHIRERADVIRPCLKENGYPLDPDASVDVLIATQWELTVETQGAVDCMTAAGVGSY